MMFSLVSAGSSQAQVCDKRKILTLMAQKNIINLKDRSVCLDMHDFPNFRIKMKDQDYGLDKNRMTEGPSEQDLTVGRIVKLLNNSKILEPGKKFTVISKGVADGTYNGPPDRESDTYAEDLKEENDFLSLISENGIISPKKVQDVIGAYDRAGAAAIVKSLSAYYDRKGRTAFSKIDEKEKGFEKKNTKLKSLVQNSIRARARGKFLCARIFGKAEDCKNQGEISPLLDTGEHNFSGCCVGRRGAVIDIVPPESLIKTKSADASFHPDFRKTSTGLQTKLNLAASMSVFSLKLLPNDALEERVLSEKDFSPEVVELDRKRFAEALKGTGCEKNPFAIDAVRRIFWQVKANKQASSAELMSALSAGNFDTVYKFYEERSRAIPGDLDLLTILSTGGNYAGYPTSKAPLIPAYFHPNATKAEGGMPTDAMNCLDVSKALQHELMSSEGQEALHAGVPYCQSKPTSLNMNIEKVKRHSCAQCKSGPNFDTEGNLTYQARHGNKAMRGSPDIKDRQHRHAVETFSDADLKELPLSMASLKHYRSYFLRNCGSSCNDACACLKQPGLSERLKIADVTDFSKLPGKVKKSNLLYKDEEEKTGQYACIYTPPVPDTCSINPMGSGAKNDSSENASKVSCPLEDSLDKLAGETKFDVKDLETYMTECKDLNFPATEGTCKEIIEHESVDNNRLCVETKLKAGIGSTPKKPVKSGQAKSE